MLERSLQILRPLNEPRVLVEAITFLGVVMILTGNYARALELFGEGLETATAIGDRWFAALCLTEQVSTSMMMGQSENTHERLQSAIAEWRVISDPRFTAFGLNILSLSALKLGRYDEARAALEESLALCVSVGDRWGVGSAYRGLGAIAQVQGEHTRAIDLLRKSLDTLTELGARQDVARALGEMGRSVFALGNDAEAGRIWRESLRITIETRGTHVALESLVGLASLQAKRGDTAHALELLLIVLNHPAGVQETRDRAERLQRELEAQLTRQQVEAAQARAQVKTFEAVVNEVLNQAD